MPLRSIATDEHLVSYGSLVYIKEFDGLKMPFVDPLGDFTHDGCFRADDEGSAINGYHFDFFAGSTAMYKQLEGIIDSNTYLTVYKNSSKCAYLNDDLEAPPPSMTPSTPSAPVAPIAPSTPNTTSPPPASSSEPVQGTFGSCKVNSRSGTCMDVAYCDGTATPGLCSGPASVQCCWW